MGAAIFVHGSQHTGACGTETQPGFLGVHGYSAPLFRHSPRAARPRPDTRHSAGLVERISDLSFRMTLTIPGSGRSQWRDR